MSTEEQTDDLQEGFTARLADVEFEDKLEIVGLAAGIFLVLVGLGTLVWLPATPTESGLVTVFKIIGGLATVGIGLGLMWLVQTQWDR